MKRINFCLLLIVLVSCSSTFAQKSDTSLVNASNGFELEYVIVGFGSNMFQRMPAFRVLNNKFVYTEEQVWKLKGEKLTAPDTLELGEISIDKIQSIIDVMKTAKGDSIYRLSTFIMSGASICLTIKSKEKSMVFDLHNAHDADAKKVIDILNSVIVNERKLYISNSMPDINRVKYRK